MWEWPIRELKEVNQAKRNIFAIMELPILEFGKAEAIIRLCKYFNDSPKCFQTARETTTSACKNRNIVPQIGVDTLNRECIAFVMDIPDMYSRIHYIHIPDITVRTVIFCLWSAIHDFLNI